MEIDVKNKKENVLLSRFEVTASITYEKGATPSNEQVQAALAKELKSDKDMLSIKKIKTHYSMPNATVSANLYMNKEDMQLLEPKPKKAKEGQPAEKKTEEVGQAKSDKPAKAESHKKE